jgi:uncharacterized membrane protein YhdT
VKEEISQKLLEYLQNTEEFVLDQVPEVIQQVLKYEKISSYLSAGLMILLLSIAICIGFYFWRHPTLDKYGSREFLSFMPIVSCIAIPILFVQLCYSVDKLVKIYIAPKYFLISLISSLRK